MKDAVATDMKADIRDDLKTTLRHLFVVYLNGDADELFPGISVKAVAGHSFCQIMLFVLMMEHVEIIGRHNKSELGLDVTTLCGW